MSILLNTQMLDLDDKPMKDMVPTGETNLMGQQVLTEGEILTLRRVCRVALVHPEQGVSPEEHLRRWDLAQELKNLPDPAELKSEDIVMIKKALPRVYGTTIVGQAIHLLEGK
jgi:hypothetical protein